MLPEWSPKPAQRTAAAGAPVAMNPISLSSVWTYRGFILASVRRDFQARYRNSLLGGAWMVLNPLATIAIYTIIFSQLMQPRLPGAGGAFSYTIHLCTGIITWGLFSEIISRLQNVFLDNANLIKKINFPRLCLPAVTVLGAVLNFMIVFLLFVGFLFFSGNFPGWPLVAFLPVLIVQVAFATGVGVILAVLNVFFRDVAQLTGVALQLWFWVTPIVYPVTILPDAVRNLVALNPMTILVAAYQAVVVNQQWPQWHGLLFVAALAVIFCVIGLRLLSRHIGDMMDEL
jgi:lipopolysaccharide transport system permease protein